MARGNFTMNSLKDVLSHLTFRKACRVLGAEGDRLIRTGGRYEIDIDAQATLHDDAFRFVMGNALVTITLDATAEQALCIRCANCAEPCIHQGAALSLILEEKVALGLAAPPPQREPVENLTGKELIEQAIAERRERALNEKMQFSSADPDSLWTEYSVTSLNSGKTYRVSLRGSERGSSYCSCPDFLQERSGNLQAHNLLDESTQEKIQIRSMEDTL